MKKIKKILLLMPLEEQQVCHAVEIEKLFLKYDDKCYSYVEPLFIDYLSFVLPESWVIRVILSLKKLDFIVEKVKEQNKILFVFGNSPKDQKFDIVVNYKANKDEPNEDLTLRKLQGNKGIMEDEKLNKLLTNYTQGDFDIVGIEALETFLKSILERE